MTIVTQMVFSDICLNVVDFNLFSLFLLLLNMHCYQGQSGAAKMKRVTMRWRGMVLQVARWNVMIAVIKFNLGLEFIN